MAKTNSIKKYLDIVEKDGYLLNGLDQEQKDNKG